MFRGNKVIHCQIFLDFNLGCLKKYTVKFVTLVKLTLPPPSPSGNSDMKSSDKKQFVSDLLTFIFDMDICVCILSQFKNFLHLQNVKNKFYQFL